MRDKKGSIDWGGEGTSLRVSYLWDRPSSSHPPQGTARRAGWPCCPALGGSPSDCPETHCAAAVGVTP